MIATTEPRTYAERVAANLAQMQTPRADWRALAPTGTDQDEDGKTVPTFDFSTVAGFTTAPTLYRSFPGETCCELCGRPGIKKVYHLRNDSRRWLLAVGSECVTHFEEKSGEEMAKETQDEKNLAQINAVFDTRRALADHFSRVCDRGYGRSERVWRDWSAQSLWRKLLDITGKTDM